MKSLRSLELFAGAGGMALGLAKAGFRHEAVVEWDGNACKTIRFNQCRRNPEITEWPLHQMDVRDFDYSSFSPDLDLLAGGPPCQPFSIGGKHRGHKDARNLFPEAIRAIRELRPRAVMIENVRGLIRPAFAKFFNYVLLQIRYPELVQKEAESWTDHFSRLERYNTGGKERGLYYRVVFRPINAADYGVPQKRERVFIVAFRSDQKFEWNFPPATHSLDALLSDQFVTGDYWDRHKIRTRDRMKAPESLVGRIDRLRSGGTPTDKPYLTVRDALHDLPDPELKTTIPNHLFIPGARIYPGHTGSPFDLPAKTLKAGDHGVPGGENMLAYPDGSVRYFSIRESARLQTFPDTYQWPGSWTESMRQIGNAVPVQLAQIIGRTVHQSLLERIRT